MKKRYLLILILTFSIFTSCSTTENTNSYWDNCTFERAFTRSQTLVNAINEQNPIIIYKLLSEDLRNQITEQVFIKNYNEELTYPYISPLYCYLQTIDLHYDVKGTVSCKVASRLIGENFKFTIVYEKGDYYFILFEDIVDGSYKNKFDNKVVKWI